MSYPELPTEPKDNYKFYCPLCQCGISDLEDTETISGTLVHKHCTDELTEPVLMFEFAESYPKLFFRYLRYYITEPDISVLLSAFCDENEEAFQRWAVS